MSTASQLVKTFEYEPSDISFRGRGIKPETWSFYGVTCTEDDSVIAFPFYDSETSTELVASKIKGIGPNAYSWTGDSHRAGLWGRHAFRNFGRSGSVTVTGGGEDAMAAFEMLGSKWPVVSLKGGESSAHSDLTQGDIAWLNSFDQVVVCLDGDTVGRDGAKKFAMSFPPGKVRILTLGSSKSDKDANEWLKAKRGKEFCELWWKAPVFKPDGIVTSSDLIGTTLKKTPKPIAYYPFEGLNKMLWGIYESQLVILCAGSGSGKTALSKKLILYLFDTTREKFGNLLLEEGIDLSAKNYIAQFIEENINNPQVFDRIDPDVINKAEIKLFGGDRFLFWDHFGSSDIDTVCATVRYFAHNCGCKFVLLDHISIVVSSQENGDERKALDEAMTKLRKVCEETRITLFVVSHLKRPNGSDAHEEGGVTSLAQLRGSAGLGQLADVVLGLERNGQHEDPFIRNTSAIRVLKSRKTGLTGVATRVLWDNNKSTFTELRSDWKEHLGEIAKQALVDELGGETTPVEIF